MAINKSTGVTNTERYLANVCERTFLGLWSYPNPYKDDGKELCDLIAVFENHVFVFFDRQARHLAAPDKDVLLQWDRWKREAIDRQIQTASGAERYLRSGRKVYLDAKASTRLPLSIPANPITHKFVVAHGAAEACKAFSDDNVTGSLGIGYGDAGMAGVPALPFMIGLDRVSPVHVADSHTLPILLSELDTFVDLLWYLEAKGAAIAKYDLLTYCGEEDLLGHYFFNFNEASNRHFIGVADPKVNGLFIGEGEWQDFLKRDEYKRMKEANKVSYFWDEIIQRTATNALNGTLMGDNVFAGPSPIQEMAKEPRFMRRALSEQMMKAIENFPDLPGKVSRNVSFMPSFHPGTGYVFLQLRVRGETDENPEYRKKRQALLQVACAAAKLKFPDLQKVVGIAIDAPRFNPKTTDDHMLLDCREWPDELRTHYAELNKDFGFFTSETMRVSERKAQQFPDD